MKSTPDLMYGNADEPTIEVLIHDAQTVTPELIEYHVARGHKMRAEMITATLRRITGFISKKPDHAASGSSR